MPTGGGRRRALLRSLRWPALALLPAALAAFGFWWMLRFGAERAPRVRAALEELHRSEPER